MITKFVATLKTIVSGLQKDGAIVLAVLTELGMVPDAGHNANAQAIILATYAAIVHAVDSAKEYAVVNAKKAVAVSAVETSKP